MRKNFIFFLISLFLAMGSVNAQNNGKKIIINSKKNSLNLIEAKSNGFKAVNNVGLITTSSINTKKGAFEELLLDGYSKTYYKGEPRLPETSKMIEIPQGAEVIVKVVSYEEQELNLADYGINHKLLPDQPSLSKSQDPNSVPFYYNEKVYSQNQFLGRDLARVEISGTMRGVKIGRLVISPLQYNPVTNVVKLFNNIQVEVSFKNANTSKTKYLKKKNYSPYFDRQLNNTLANYKKESKSLYMKTPVKFVIVADPMFQETLQPFIAWKKKKGFTVIEAYTNNPDVGTTTTTIKAYLQGLYEAGTEEDPAPTFVLLVGDHGQIPAFNGKNTIASCITDVYYVCYDGASDNIPDVVCGRFSANNVAELQPQIDRTLEYERYEFPDPSFLNNIVIVAGADGTYAPTHGNPTANYINTYYANSEHGLTPHKYLYPASETQDAEIRAKVNEGACIANYTAHCSKQGWSDPTFEINHISDMDNNHKFPLIISNCCQTTMFETTCFAEMILRTPEKGAIGHIGGSESSYWDEDVYWGVGLISGSITGQALTYDNSGIGAYDAMFHEGEEPEDKWALTQGQLNIIGNLQVEASSSSRKLYYWEIYHLFGDPSLMVYASEAEEMTATYQSTLLIGLSTLEVTTLPGAYVALSFNNEILAVGVANASGIANLEFETLSDVGNASLVITAQNRQPHIATIEVIPNEGAFITVGEYTVANESGACYAQEAAINMTLKNVGSDATSDVVATLTTEDENVTITEGTKTFGSFAGNATVNIENAFKFTVANNVEDQHVAEFKLEIKDNLDSVWTSKVRVTLNAPVVELEYSSLVEEAGLNFVSVPIKNAGTGSGYEYNVEVAELDGNGNGFLDAGETATLKVKGFNKGHAEIANLTCTVSTESEYATVTSEPVSIAKIAANGEVEIPFVVNVAENTPTGTSISFKFTLGTEQYSTELTLGQKVGLIIEDFETGDLSAYDWQTSGDVTWSATDAEKHEGTYSATAGTVGNSKKAILEITLDVTVEDSISFFRKVSCEEPSSYSGTLYDYLEFSIDGTSKKKWAGEQGWEEVKYKVTTGSHTFKWEFKRDSYGDGGDNTAWLDYIILPPHNTATKKITRRLENVTITGETLPSWLTFTDNGDGTAKLSGTPTQEGSADVVLKAVSGGKDVTQTYSITIVNDMAIDNFDLEENVTIVPNPIKENSKVIFKLNSVQKVNIEIYNSLGKKIQTLVNNLNLKAGGHTVDLDNTKLNTGVYFCRITMGNKSVTKRIVVTK